MGAKVGRPRGAGRKPRCPERLQAHGTVPRCRSVPAGYPRRRRRHRLGKVHADYRERRYTASPARGARMHLPDFGETPRRQGPYREHLRFGIFQGGSPRQFRSTAGQGFRARHSTRRLPHPFRRPPGRSHRPRNGTEPDYHRRARHRKDDRHRLFAVEAF